MEEKNDIGLKHRAHEHLLILNENYIAKEGNYCIGCQEQIDSCKSSFVYCCSNITGTTSTDTSGVEYRCVRFLLHKTCAELPLKIVNPTDQNEFLFFEPRVFSWFLHCCIVCGFDRTKVRFAYCRSIYSEIYVCITCAIFQVQQSKEDPIFVHPDHSHPLALIEEPSSFKCGACKVNDNRLDSSYRCTKCQFWIHKSCGDAPSSFQFQFHKHPLSLSFSLPEVYRKFHQFCRICNERMSWKDWLYCCRSCRYFTHFQCARSRSSPVLSSSENKTYPDLVQLPAADEISLNLLLEQFIKDKVTDLSHSYNGNSISSATNYIKHWSHEEHDLKLIATHELYDRKNDDEILLLCDGCVKPIRTNEGQSYYGCVPCKYFMHKVCAEFPREAEHLLWPGGKLFANKYSESFKLFKCYSCKSYGNGIFFSDQVKPRPYDFHLHIGCLTLPKVIKHEAHHHQLQLHDRLFISYYTCNACGHHYDEGKYQCEECQFSICGKCIMQAKTYKHRWDPHPMELIYDVGMVEEHEHEFDCEFCSKEINTNKWFYHCCKCDLSFHTYCILKLSYAGMYKDVKFGATDIIKDQLHPHRLTFVLNKKVRRCINCNKKSLGKPVLQCAPCNNSVIFCFNWRRWCCDSLI